MTRISGLELTSDTQVAYENRVMSILDLLSGGLEEADTTSAEYMMDGVTVGLSNCKLNAMQSGTTQPASVPAASTTSPINHLTDSVSNIQIGTIDCHSADLGPETNCFPPGVGCSTGTNLKNKSSGAPLPSEIEPCVKAARPEAAVYLHFRHVPARNAGEHSGKHWHDFLQWMTEKGLYPANL